jgi:predicted Zn-dependent peptidase
MSFPEELNRKHAPATGKILEFPISLDHPVPPFNFLRPTQSSLDNGVPLLCVNAKSGAITRVDLAYKAGKWFQTKPLLAFFTGQLLKEGYISGSQTSIASFFEYYGAYLSFSVENDYSIVQLYCQNRHLSILLPVLVRVLREPQFPMQEFEALKMAQKQDLMINLEKVAFKARQEFNRLIFGECHPYGALTMPAHFDQILRNDLIDFHSNTYFYKPEYVLLSGFYTTIDLAQINTCFGSLPIQPKPVNPTFEIASFSEMKAHIEHPNALQAALRLGKISVNKSDTDYVAVQLLTTVLGGYFGSRLMRNIREDKGLTYGINAWLMPQLNASSLVIASETNADKGWKALEEIRLEIARLQKEELPLEELQLVKNYLTGSFLRTIDGPFGLADRIRSVYETRLNPDFYIDFLNQLNSISQEELLLVANKHFNLESFYTVTVGL